MTEVNYHERSGGSDRSNGSVRAPQVASNLTAAGDIHPVCGVLGFTCSFLSVSIRASS